MKVTFNLALVMLLALALPGATAWAQAVQAMKMLTAQTGWVQSDLSHLLWTTDGSAHWKDISPPKSSNEIITGTFFLDTSIGWVALSHEDDKDQQQFRVASTHDGGATWSMMPLELPWKRYADDFAGGAGVFFLDQIHGWINLDMKSSSSFSLSRLLATSDGGKTWKAPPGDSGEGGSLCFFSQADGILAGGPQSSELWVTHDGAKSWSQLSLKAPPSTGPGYVPSFDKPGCAGSSGFLPVTFSGPDGSMSVLVLFTTKDAGSTWGATTVIANLEETSPGQVVPSAVVDSNLLAATRAKGGVILTIVSPSGEVKQLPFTGFTEVPELSFADLVHGWASTHAGMFSTTDGGTSWNRITPGVSALNPPETREVR